MKPIKLIIICAVIALVFSACSLPNSTPAPSAAPTATPIMDLPLPVETATIPPATSQATSAPTATPSNTSTSPTTAPTAAGSSSSGACTNSADFVADISVPDGSVLDTDISLVKTWRVKNTGTCTWDSRYSLVFTDGTLFVPVDHMPLPGSVAPGQTIDLDMNMTTPIYPGTYESDWKLRSPSGILFGVGKKDSPLWIKVVISSPDTTVIMGYVYQDKNGNAVYDKDDVLMANREVWLQQSSCNPNAASMASVTSGSDGRYVISGPFAGTLCVGLKSANGMEDIATFSATAGQTITNMDLRAANPSAMISGKVWNDSLQPDGVFQDSETVLANVVVLVQRGVCGSPVSVPVSAITDANGHFFFGDLYSGVHCISIRANDGNNTSIFGNGAWVSPANGIQQITVNPGEEGVVNFAWQNK